MTLMDRCGIKQEVAGEIHMIKVRETDVQRGGDGFDSICTEKQLFQINHPGKGVERYILDQIITKIQFDKAD